jgi:hypothetical protein
MPKDPDYFRADNEIYRQENIASSLFFMFDIVIETRVPSLDTLVKPFAAASLKFGNILRRWVDNIKMDLKEIGWDGVDWIELAQGRNQWRALVNTV